MCGGSHLRREWGILGWAALTAVVVEVLVVDGFGGPERPPGDGSGAVVPGRRPVPGPLVYGELVTDPPGPMTLTSFSITRLEGSGREAGVDTYILDPRTGGFTETTYVQAAMSPDARTVAGIETDRRGKNGRLVVLDRATGRERRIDLPFEPAFPRWSPRGRRILSTVFTGGLEVVTRGFVITDAGTLRSDFTAITLGSRPVTGEYGLVASWDADGDQVVLLTPSAQGARLHRIDPRGGELGAGLPLPGASAEWPGLLSPDGQMLATACHQPRDSPQEQGICLWDTSGPPDRPPRRIRRLAELLLRAWYDPGHLLAGRHRGTDERRSAEVTDQSWEQWGGWEQWGKSLANYYMELVLVDLHGRELQVIVRDSALWPGPAMLGNFSPIPP